MPVKRKSAVAKNKKKQLVTEMRRGEILEAAARVFGAQGFDPARMDEIAAEAGLTKATVYAYFESKDAIYEAVVEEALRELTELVKERVDMQKHFRDKVRAYITVRLMFWEQKQTLYGVIASVNSAAKNRKRAIRWTRRTVDYLVGMFEQAQRDGEIPAQNFETVAWGLFDMLKGVYDRRLVGEDRNSLEEDVRSLTAFTLRGLGCKRV